MAVERIFAAVLAGGAGSRMGGGKPLTLLSGAPLAVHAARALRGAEAMAVVGDASVARVLNAVALSDPPVTANGPLSGVLAALEWATGEGAEWVAFAPCDTPFLPDDLVVRLRRTAGDGDLSAVESKTGLEPLISMWRARLALPLREVLAGGEHPPVHRLMRELGVARLPLDEAETFNVNTRDDLAEAEALLAQR